MKTLTLFHTIKHLRWRQLAYNIYYRLRPDYFMRIPKEEAGISQLKGEFYWLNSKDRYLGNSEFSILNIDHTFDKQIDWNDKSNGLLWCYHLNYFEFLNNNDLKPEEGLELLRNFIHSRTNLSIGQQPYPSSLRVMNVIKFVLSNDLQKERDINTLILSDARLLSFNLEYHLMANHLLENGLALLMAGIYLNDDRLVSKGQGILKVELKEQILKDGGHFERSPMYHNLILVHLLDLIQVLQKSEKEILASPYIAVAQAMLSFSSTLSFSDGSLPPLNDSAPLRIIPIQIILDYARRLEIFDTASDKGAVLNDSYLRKYTNRLWEVAANLGGILPSYQPGHCHDDSLHFVFHFNGIPIMVDRGVSTYEEGESRMNERCTGGHNTVSIGERSASELWASFRVGNRPTVKILDDGETGFEGVVLNYGNLGASHSRKLHLDLSGIYVMDRVDQGLMATAHFHFDADVVIHPNGKLYRINETLQIQFKGAKNIRLESYDLALDFNKKVKASKLEVDFYDTLRTRILKVENS